MVRTQLPLQLAWAVTGYKSQGLTLPRIRLGLERKEFSCGNLQSFHFYPYDPVRKRFTFDETLLPGFAAHLGWTLGNCRSQ
ncbi:hypothetical protein V8E52_006735 [Russula decolorans]